MKKSDEMMRFEKDLAADEELAKKLDEAVKEATQEDGVTCDGEALVRAARSLGYQLSLTELEQEAADKEPLDLEEMELIAGGASEVSHCTFIYKTSTEDEHGHNAWCYTAWHCLTVTLHTKTESTEVQCWSDYRCNWLNE